MQSAGYLCQILNALIDPGFGHVEAAVPFSEISPNPSPVGSPLFWSQFGGSTISIDEKVLQHNQGTF